MAKWGFYSVRYLFKLPTMLLDNIGVAGNFVLRIFSQKLKIKTHNLPGYIDRDPGIDFSVFPCNILIFRSFFCKSNN